MSNSIVAADLIRIGTDGLTLPTQGKAVWLSNQSGNPIVDQSTAVWAPGESVAILFDGHGDSAHYCGDVEALFNQWKARTFSDFFGHSEDGFNVPRSFVVFVDVPGAAALAGKSYLNP